MNNIDIFDLINKIGFDILKPIAQHKNKFNESNNYINNIYSSLYNIVNETILYPDLCLDKLSLKKDFLHERKIDIEFGIILYRKNKNKINEKIYEIIESIKDDNLDSDRLFFLSLEKSSKDIESYFKNYERRLHRIYEYFSKKDKDYITIYDKISKINKNNIFYLKKDYES